MGSTGGHFRPSSGKGTLLSLQLTAVVGQTLHLEDSWCRATHLQGHACGCMCSTRAAAHALGGTSAMASNACRCCLCRPCRCRGLGALLAEAPTMWQVWKQAV